MMADTRQADEVQQAPDEWQPRPGEPHPIDKAFYNLTVKERDYERMMVDRLRAALKVPLRETILAVLQQMPSDAVPEHVAVQIESQVRAWQALQMDRF